MSRMGHESASNLPSTKLGRTRWQSRVGARLARMYPERKALLIVASGSAVLIILSAALAFGERASEWETIKTGSSHRVDLDAGEEVGIYLTAQESMGLNFDIYPSDIECHVTGPVGEDLVAIKHADGIRAIDGWVRHFRVATWRASQAGIHRSTCDEFGEFSVVLAVGEEAWRAPIEPLLVAWVLTFLVVPIAVVVLIGSLACRGIARLVACRRLNLTDTS